jgi:hypothetical protein
VTTEDLLEFLSAQCQLNLAPDTLRRRLRIDPELRRIKGIPMEQSGDECDPRDAQLYFEELARLVNGKPASLIFNLEESGFQDWADRRVRHVILPASYQGDEIPVPMDRSIKRMSLLV